MTPLADAQPRREGLAIGLAAENGEWHRARLLAAFRPRRRAGAVLARRCRRRHRRRASRCAFPASRGLPDGCCCAPSRAAPSRPTTLRLGVLHALVAAGVVVWNSPVSIERSVDKSMTSLLVQRAGLPTPDTFVASSREAAAAIVAARGRAPTRRWCSNPCSAPRARGSASSRGPRTCPSRRRCRRVYYLQRFVPRIGGSWRDYRVFVCDGRVVAGMVREGRAGSPTCHKGGRPPSLAGAGDGGGPGAGGGAGRGRRLHRRRPDRRRRRRLSVLEVNSMPAWNGLQKVTDADIAAAIVDGFLKAVHAARGLQLAAAS